MTTKSNRTSALSCAAGLTMLVSALLCTLPASRVEARAPMFRPAGLHAGALQAAPAAPWVWTEQKVTANNGMPHDAFGQAIAISGTTALIGAVDVNDWEGAIYVFSQNGRRLERRAGVHGRRWRSGRSGHVRHRDHDRRHDGRDRRAWRYRQRTRESGRGIRLHRIGRRVVAGRQARRRRRRGEQLLRADRRDRRVRTSSSAHTAPASTDTRCKARRTYSPTSVERGRSRTSSSPTMASEANSSAARSRCPARAHWSARHTPRSTARRRAARSTSTTDRPATGRR